MQNAYLHTKDQADKKDLIFFFATYLNLLDH